MKVNALLYVFVSSLFTFASAQQDPGPSPTESVECEPHEDHWHCDRPATVSQTAAPVTVTSVETPGPSPIESVGCEPHGDHWHCDGPAAVPQTEAATTVTSAEDPGPSPTESVGCEPHGDHWHCDYPAAGVTGTATTSHDEHEPETGTPAVPSPTESVECEPHGDHWHCDGPATDFTASAGSAQATGSASINTTASATSSLVPFQGAANALYSFNGVKLFGVVAGVGVLVVM